MVVDGSIHVPLDYPTSVIYVDESGVASNGPVFVVGAVKVRKHGEVMRAMRSVREKHEHWSELRFNRISFRTIPIYFDLIDEVFGRSYVHIHGTIVERARVAANGGERARLERWEAHSSIVALLLKGAIRKRELVSVSLDMISTPPDVAIEDDVRNKVNRSLGCQAVISAACQDSASSDGLQLADLVASAIAWEWRAKNLPASDPDNHKSKVVRRLRDTLNVDSLVASDTSPRYNVRSIEGLPRWDAPRGRRERRS